MGHPVVMKVYPIELRVVAANDSICSYVVRVYWNMFRLMYKEPSSRLEGTKEKLYITPKLFYIVLVYFLISTYIIIKNTVS